MKKTLLKINNLTACIGDKTIIKSFNLEIKSYLLYGVKWENMILVI
jgi:Fe-S cluster assembly ATPase SufC